MTENRFSDLLVPEEQISRQAIDSLHGYIYQLYQTLLRWTQLEDSELLLMEVAEDYAVMAQNALKQTQVKDTKGTGNVTLRNNDVLKTILSLRSFQQENPNISISVNYLTTSATGKEKGISFPDNMNGLDYWNIATRENSDIEPLRTALLKIFDEKDARSENENYKDITEYINQLSDDDFRDHIVRPIRWDCGAPDLAKVDEVATSNLIVLGEKFSVPPSDCSKAKDNLFVYLINKCILPNDADRCLNRAELLSIFEKYTMTSVPISFLKKVMSGSIAVKENIKTEYRYDNLLIDVKEIPLPKILALRSEMIDLSKKKLAETGLLWIHGSSGIGKSLTAKIIAKNSNRKWYFVSLQGKKSDEVTTIINIALRKKKLDGVIIDDLLGDISCEVLDLLSILTTKVKHGGGSVIITSQNEPSYKTLSNLGTNTDVLQKMYYLSSNEISELISNSGGDADKWTNSIFIFSGRGHPQLACARISGLASRKWPNIEILDGFTASQAEPEDIELERKSIRQKLINILPENCRELLYKLSVIIGDYDRELAIAVAGVEPSISLPGECFDSLVGPWIEKRGKDRYAVSPLLQNSGSKTFERDMLLKIHIKIAENIISRNPIFLDKLHLLLSHSVVGSYSRGLEILTRAVYTSNDIEPSLINNELLMLPFLNGYDSKPLISTNLYLSVMLRLLQFRVAAQFSLLERMEVLSKQLVGEAKEIESQVIREPLLMTVILVVLMELKCYLSPSIWVPLVVELEELSKKGNEIAESLRSYDNSNTQFRDLSIPEAMFMSRASNIKGMADLKCFLEELDKLGCKLRNKLLDSLKGEIVNANMVMNSAWTNEVKSGHSFPTQQFIANYKEYEEIFESWGRKELAIACVCAQSILVDEYENNVENAMGLLDEAEKKYPNSLELPLRRAKILYRREDYSSAISIFEKKGSEVSELGGMDQVYYYRELGISFAKIGDIEKSIESFEEALGNKVVDLNEFIHMKIGLLIDCAILEFKVDQYMDSLTKMAMALELVEKHKDRKDRFFRYRKIILGHVLTWMNQNKDESEVREIQYTVNIGMCSDLDPSEEISNRRLQPDLIHWYQLAELELYMDVNCGVWEKYKERTALERILVSEFVLLSRVIRKSIVNRDVDLFFSSFENYIRVAKEVKDNDSFRSENAFFNTVKAAEYSEPANWDESQKLIAMDSVLALCASLVGGGRQAQLKIATNRFNELQNIQNVLPEFISSFSEFPTENSVQLLAAHSLSLIDSAKLHFTPHELYNASYYLLSWLVMSDYHKHVEEAICTAIFEKWKYVITHMKSVLIYPMVTVPKMMKRFQNSQCTSRKLAKLLLVADKAVGVDLGNELRKQIVLFSED